MPTLVYIHDEKIEKLLRRFKVRGGIVNYFIFRCEGEENEIECHRAVARESLQLLLEQRHQESLDYVEKRYAEIAQELTIKIERQRKNHEFSEVDFRKLAEQQHPMAVLNESFDDEIFSNDVPERISVDEFMGVNDKDLKYYYAFFCPSEPTLRDFQPGDEGFHPEDAKVIESRWENESRWFVNALMGDRVIFTALNDRLFGELKHLVIYRWGTKCSDFFEDEDAYLWGNYFWTVYSPTYDWYVAILAAATID